MKNEINCKIFFPCRQQRRSLKKEFSATEFANLKRRTQQTLETGVGQQRSKRVYLEDHGPFCLPRIITEDRGVL